MDDLEFPRRSDSEGEQESVILSTITLYKALVNTVTIANISRKLAVPDLLEFDLDIIIPFLLRNTRIAYLLLHESLRDLLYATCTCPSPSTGPTG